MRFKVTAVSWDLIWFVNETKQVRNHSTGAAADNIYWWIQSPRKSPNRRLQWSKTDKERSRRSHDARTDTETTTHSNTLSVSTAAQRWNIIPLTVSLTPETLKQHVYALSAPTRAYFYPPPHLPLFFNLSTPSLSLFFSVNLSFLAASVLLFLHPWGWSHNLSRLFSICSHVLLAAFFCPSGPPSCPLLNPPSPSLSFLVYFSTPLLSLGCGGPWGPSSGPGLICVTFSQRSLTRQHSTHSNTLYFLERL